MPSSQFDLLLAVKSTGAAETANQIKSIGTAAQQTGNATNTLPSSFAKVTQTATGMNTQITKTRQVMGATVTTVSNTTKATQGWTSVLKNNVLAIGSAVSGVIGLVAQYTQLQKTQLATQRSAVQLEAAQNKVSKLTTKLANDIQKYGQNSKEVAQDAADLSVAQGRLAVAQERNSLNQEHLNEQIADFAVNILPNLISVGSGVIQVIQGFRSAQQEAAAVTTITGDAIAVQNAQMAISKVGAAELAVANKGLAASEIATGEAATVAGTAMRTALIRTGIGALLVAAGTALVAFTQNWWGFRDAVNSAGAAIGKFLPGLTPMLNLLQQVGEWMNRLFGTEIPQSADAASTAIEGVGAAGTKAAEATQKAAEEISKSWSDIFKSIDISAFSGKNKFKDQFKAIRELGFGKSGVHKIKFALELADTEQSLFSKISKALGIIRVFHLPASDQRKWANNIIDDLSKGIKDQPELKNILQPLVDIIRNNKKSSNLGLLVAQYFESLPEDVKAVLSANQIDIPGLIKNMGFTEEAIKSSLQSVTQKAFGSKWFPKPKEGETMWFGTPGSSGAHPVGEFHDEKKNEDGVTSGQSFATNFVAGFKTGLTQVAGTLDTVIATVAKGWDVIFKGLGAGDAAWFSVGWQSFKDFGGQVMTWVTSALDTVNKTVQGLGAGAAAWFTTGWTTLKDTGATIISWLDLQLGGQGARISKIGSDLWTIIQNGWVLVKDAGTTIVTWLSNQINGAKTTLNSIGGTIWTEIQAGIKAAQDRSPKNSGDPFAGLLGLFGFGKVQTAEGGTPTGQDQANKTVQGNQPQAQLQITDATKNITRLIGNFMGYVSVVTKANPAAKLDITGAVKSITRLIGDFGGWFSIVQKANPKARIDITGAVKSITRLIGDFNGYVKTVEKTNPKVKIDITGAVKSIDRLIGDLQGIPNISRTVTIHTNHVTDFAKGGILSFAKGGVISAESGRIFTSSHEQLVNISDNPGQRESVAFVPHDNPFPTLERLFGMFFGGGSHGGSGNGDININLQTRIDGNGIVNDRLFEQRIRKNLGGNMRRFR